MKTTQEIKTQNINSGAIVEIKSAPPIELNGLPTISGVLNYFYISIHHLFSEYILSSLILLTSIIYFAALGERIKYLFSRILEKRIFSISIKRIIDIIGASVGLILTFPVFMVLPILIKLDSPGPVFFRQLRVGVNRRRKERRKVGADIPMNQRRNDRRNCNIYGKPFTIYKFRTMRQDAEKLSGPVWASKDDPRITKLGKFLRVSRLDEIPQLFNVLRGDMSLVGPRPERPYFVEKLITEIDCYPERLKVKPGITGLAQVEHHYDQCIEDVRKKVSYDLEYIRRWNIIRDIKIMFKTIIVMALGKGV